jgi:hypothetical protein
MSPLPLVGFTLGAQRSQAGSVPRPSQIRREPVAIRQEHRLRTFLVILAVIQCCGHTPPAGDSGMGTVMRINRMIVLQAMMATFAGLAVMYAQKRVGGPFGGIIPGVLGFLVGWLVTAAIPDDIESLRRWLHRRRASRGLQPK